MQEVSKLELAQVLVLPALVLRKRKLELGWRHSTHRAVDFESMKILVKARDEGEPYANEDAERCQKGPLSNF